MGRSGIWRRMDKKKYRVKNPRLLRKQERLRENLRKMGSVLVAFSGGVDSAFLLKAARDALGDRVLAITAVSEIHPPAEKDDACRLARRLGVRHLLVKTGELRDPDFVRNCRRRCYYCKKKLFARLKLIARSEGLNFVADGTNADDRRVFRPGRKALAELKVRSPLAETGLTKSEIRLLARGSGLPVWNKPPRACLASRLPYGMKITAPELKRIREAEGYLLRQGFRQVRVRNYGAGCRIEVDPAELPRFVEEDRRRRTMRKLRTLGFRHVGLDLEGYRSGSMDEV